MDLTSDHPYWRVRHGLLATYPFLDRDRSCDVAVVGAGVTGALVAERLAAQGLDVVVLDRRDAACGSTAASTALLQYEIDVPLVELADRVGPDDAARAYRLSWASIDGLEAVIRRRGIRCGFARRTSIFRAGDEEGAELLEREDRARRECGIRVELLGPAALRDRHHLDGTAALVSEQAAACDPYRLTHGLLASVRADGSHVFDRTEVVEVDPGADRVRLRTDRGPVVTAGHVVFATGYEARDMLEERVVDLRSTYAVVSQPLATRAPWDDRWVFWETGDPYLYLRTTEDGRLMAGGEDDRFRNPRRRDARVGRKARTLHEKVRALIPGLEWEVEFAWAGTFGTTRDGLAYIGATDEYPGCLFALGYGGNGITFSQIASDLLSSVITGGEATGADLFRFGR